MNATEIPPAKYTLKGENGRYFAADFGAGKRGFISEGLAGCYSYRIDEIRDMQKAVGGIIVEVIRKRRPGSCCAFDYEERPL